MPYPSRRFSDLSPPEVEAYEWGFADRLLDVVAGFQPQVIHSHHLWLLTAVARQMFPHLPLVATCHGSDLRQFHFCPHLRPRVLAGMPASGWHHGPERGSKARHHQTVRYSRGPHRGGGGRL